jgi:hypothetical protein
LIQVESLRPHFSDFPRATSGSSQLDLLRPPGKEPGMAARNPKNKPSLPRLSYTSRVHLKRRIEAIDFKFLAAVAALAAATWAIIRYA